MSNRNDEENKNESNIAVKTLSTTFSLYRSVKSVASVVLHPLKYVRNKMRDYFVEKLINKVLEKTNEDFKNKVSGAIAKTINFDIPLPNKFAPKISEENLFLKELTVIANDCLEIPLAAIGYSIGEVNLKLNEKKDINVNIILNFKKS